MPPRSPARRLALALVGVLCASLALAASRRPASAWAYAVPEMVKLGPGQDCPRASRIELDAARGECTAAQIVAEAPVERFRVAVSPLHRPGAPAVVPRLYREGFLDLEQASNVEGRPGRWPDPLIPERDAWFDEPRRAFPASSREGPVVAYLEVCVGARAPPGRYEGEATARAQGRPAVVIPIGLRVRGYALPATSSLPTSFGFSAIAAARAHGLPDDALLELNRLYALSALSHRLSLHGMSMQPPTLASASPPRLDFSALDAEIGPLLDGTALPSGARFTSIDVRVPGALSTDASRRVAYLRLYADHLREKGWLDRAFVYLKDEPRPRDLPEVLRFAREVHQACPELRALVTTPLTPALEGAIDLWTPNLNCLFARDGDDYCKVLSPAGAYAAERARGAKLWWYQSCGSHACGPVPERDRRHLAYFAGWPSYMVDHDAALNRAMGALAFRHGIDGELYFNTVEAYLPAAGTAGPADPWRDLWRFHGNGDGTLFYPGTPERIGGTHHVPVESLRLKLVRAGLQDYELLALARSVGLQAAADEAARALAPQPFQIVRDPQAWQRSRGRLADLVEAALKAPEYRDAGGVQGAGRP